MSDERDPFLAAMADDLPDGLIAVRRDGTVVYANRTFATLVGLPLEDVLGTDLLLLMEAPGADGVEALFAAGSRTALVTSSGQATVPVEVRGRPVADGDDSTYVGLVRRLDATMAPPLEPGEAVRLVAEVLESIEDGVAVCDDDGRIVLVNNLARQLFGIPGEGPSAGVPFPLHVELRAADGSTVRFEDHPLARALGRTQVIGEHVVLDDEADHRHHLLVSARPIELGDSSGAVLVAREITSQLDEQARLLQLALHDPLTGLANRSLLLDHLERSLRRVRSRGGTMAVVIVDIDGFRFVNEEHGVDVGDEILRAIGRRLQASARSSDLVARLSGDEFLLVATAGVLEPDVVAVMAERIAAALGAPVRAGDRSLTMQSSVAWVLADPRRDDPTTLLVRADKELRRRKSVRRPSQQAGEA